MGYTTTTSKVQMDDGVNLHVKVIGDNPTSTAKPLLISLHGAPGLSTHLEPEASFAFLSDVFRVLVFDARGSGESDKIGPYSHDQWIKDIETLRRWAGAQRFVLAGASYGSFIALDYAIRHWNILDGLILRAPWANGKLGPMQALANILLSDRVNVDADRQVRLWSGNLYDDKDFEDSVVEILPFYTPPDDVASVGEDLEPPPESTEFRGTVIFNSATQNHAFSVNMPSFDVREQLKVIRAPTLIAVGRHDRVTPVAYSQEIASSIPNTQLEIFERSGHSPPSDEPQKFEKVVHEWLKTACPQSVA